ncbi:rhomboid family intramembrane serine protease [Anaeromyxobacter terrae]|uniref:rhomboid family intramembrane serine protease n=1 Tax=Anaeromyxobacter terrae TaxID=2925406 RepID=UPI001F5AAC4D|nr:rhomboid family intramembrane serine protease [Anaeromyxobacter sp. SG22]
MDAVLASRRPLPRRSPGVVPATWALAVANAAAFALVLSRGDPSDPALLVRLGALERSRVWAGEAWRLVTAGFLHGGWQHLTMNLGALLLAGPIVERGLGRARFLGLYLGSVVAASAASLLGHDAVVAGASGGVFGVVGALLVLELRRAGSVRRFLAAPHVALVVGALAIGFVGSRLFPAGLPVDDFAHGGGLLTGAAAAWLLTRPAPRTTWPWAAFGLALAVALTAAVWPRAGTTRFQAEELERQIYAALRREDVAESRRLLSVADARGQRSPALDYFRALVQAQGGDLEGALLALRALATSAGVPLRDDVRRSGARVARMLAYRHGSGDGRPLDPARAVAYLEESCALGEAQSCRDAAAARSAGR